MSQGTGDARRNLGIYAFLTLSLILVHVSLVLVLAPQVFQGSLIGPDSYTRLIRVVELWSDGGWWDTLLLRINAPYGLELHWTRPFDLLILAGGFGLSPLFGVKEGVFLAGVFVSPFLHVVASLLLVWAVRPLIDPRVRPLILIAFLAQPLATSYAVAGRVDHHLLLILVYVLCFGFLLRSIAKKGIEKPAFICGILAGFGVWVSVEFLLAWFVLAASLLTLWLVDFRQATRRLVFFASGFSLMVLFGVLLETPPSRLLSPVYDRISTPFLFGSLLFLLFGLSIQGLERKVSYLGSVGKRLLTLGIGLVVTAAMMWAFFPEAFADPMAAGDPRFSDLFLRHIDELQSLLPTELSKVGTTVANLGSAVFAFPFLIWMLRSNQEPRTRALWLAPALGAMVSLPICLFEARYGIWVALPLTVGVVGFLQKATEHWNLRDNGRKASLLWVLLTTGVITGPLFLGAGLTAVLGGYVPVSERSAGPDCSVGGLTSTFLASTQSDTVWTLLTGPDFGPEIAYRTGHNVVAAPYHRNRKGILDTYDILAGTSESTSEEIIRRRGVDFLILCPPQDAGFFLQKAGGGQTLYERLVAGQEPEWLTQRALPASAGSGFLVFEVR